MANLLVKLTALLILSGMMLHEAIPHHHHSEAGHVHTCCESHEHNDAEPNDVQPCTILSNIHFENFKPEILVYSKEVKHSHNNILSAACQLCFSKQAILSDFKTPIFIPQSVFSETEYFHTFSFRGPPSA